MWIAGLGSSGNQKSTWEFCNKEISRWAGDGGLVERVGWVRKSCWLRYLRWPAPPLLPGQPRKLLDAFPFLINSCGLNPWAWKMHHYCTLLRLISCGFGLDQNLQHAVTKALRASNLLSRGSRDINRIASNRGGRLECPHSRLTASHFTLIGVTYVKFVSTVSVCLMLRKFCTIAVTSDIGAGVCSQMNMCWTTQISAAVLRLSFDCWCYWPICSKQRS